MTHIIWAEVWVCYTYCTVVHPTPRYSAEYLARFLWLAPPHPNTSTSGLLPPLFSLGSLITILVSLGFISGKLSSTFSLKELEFRLIVRDTSPGSFMTYLTSFFISGKSSSSLENSLMFSETRPWETKDEDRSLAEATWGACSRARVLWQEEEVIFLAEVRTVLVVTTDMVSSARCLQSGVRRMSAHASPPPGYL